MKASLVSIFRYFRGRRSQILFISAIALIGTSVFLVAPSWGPPASAATGGGDASVLEKRHSHTAATRPPISTSSTSQKFITLNAGDVLDLSPGPVSFGGHPELLSRIGSSWKFRAESGGHAVLSVGSGAALRRVFLFVTPMPSRQVTRNDLDWYRTQFGTGIANCGPALVSMSILWARGQDIPVQEIRSEIGYPYDDGATSFDDLRESLERHRVAYRTSVLSGPQDLVNVLAHGHLALVLIQSGGIAKVSGDPSRNLVGRYYDDDLGHYVLVKGYSLDQGYFVVYDPYPVDWESNSLRYSDAISPIGKNRYYPAGQLFGALKTKMILEVTSD
jgi:hypothetical protein